MLFLVCVDRRTWIGIADGPEIFDELFPFLICSKFEEIGLFASGNDVTDVPGQPLLIVRWELVVFVTCGGKRRREPERQSHCKTQNHKSAYEAQHHAP